MKNVRDIRIDHIKAEAEKGEDRTQHIHVTDLSRCLAGVWQEKTGRATQEFNESKLRRFDAGHIIESRVVEACEHAKVLLNTQGSLNWEDVNMVGSYDLLLQEPGDAQVWLVEVKSIHPYGISHLYKSNKPHEHYAEQVNLYMNKLREEHPDIKAKLYYEALDGRTAEFEVEYDVAVVDKAMAKAKTLYDAVVADQIPAPPETFIQEDGVWKLNWRVQYSILSGLHAKCDPDNVLHLDPEKWVNKLTYQAKKMND